MRRSAQSNGAAARSALGAPPSHATAAAAAAAPSCAVAAASSASTSAPSPTAAAAAASSSSSSSSSRRSSKAGATNAASASGGRPPVVLPRSDWRLTEEVRSRPLGDCMQYSDTPFLWLCATGNVSELKHLLTIERADRDRRRRALDSKRRRGQPLGDDIDPDSEETYLTQPDDSGWSCVHWAAAFDQQAVLQLLYDAYLETLPSHLQPADSSPMARSELQSADFLHPVYLFLNRPSLALDTPLHVAAYNCHAGTMAWLLERGADIHARNMEEGSAALGHTPLMCLAEKKSQRQARARQAEAARFLLGYIRRVELAEWGDEEDVTQEQRDVDAQLRQLTLQQLTLTQPQQLPVYHTEDELPAQPAQGIDPTSTHRSHSADAETKNEPNLDGGTQGRSMDGPAGDGAVVTRSRFQSPTSASSTTAPIPVSLLASMSSINSTRSSGSTALMMAAFSGNLELVQELLSHGALVDLTLYDLRGRRVMDSALLNAVDEGHLTVARLLLQWGADRTMYNSLGETSALLVCQSDAECFRRDEHLRVAFLTLLCEEGVDSASSFAVKSFLLNHCDHNGVSPLLWAVRRGCLSVVQWLVTMGADASQPDPATNSTIVQQLIHKITRAKEKNRPKKSDYAMALMLDFFLSEPSCTQLVTEVSPELREYVAELVVQARDAEATAASAAAALIAAVPPVRKRPRNSSSSSVARSASSKPSSKRSKHAPVTPSTPSRKTSHSRNNGGSGRASRTKPKAAAPSPPRRASSHAESRSSSNPLSTAAPPRFFKGGKLTHSHATGKSDSSRGASDNEAEHRNDPVRARASSAGEMSSAHSDASDDAYGYDELDECSSEGGLSFDALGADPPTPTPTAPPAGRIQSTLAKMQATTTISAAADADVGAGAGAAGQPSGLDPLLDGSSSSLNGELNSESQIDDHMLACGLSQVVGEQLHEHDSGSSSGQTVGLATSPLKFSPTRSSRMASMLLAKSPTPSLFSPDLSSASLEHASHPHAHPLTVVTPFKEQSLPLQPMLRMHSDAPTHVSASGGVGHSHMPFLGLEAFTSHASVASSSSYASPAPHSVASGGSSNRASPPPPHPHPPPPPTSQSSFALVRSTLHQLHLNEYEANFLTNGVDDSLLGGLASTDNDDMLRELIPTVGPRMKLRTFLRALLAAPTTLTPTDPPQDSTHAQLQA